MTEAAVAAGGTAELFQLIPAVFMAAAFLCGLLLHRRSAGLAAWDRLLLVASPGFAGLALVILAAAVMHGATFYWNPPRITPIASMLAGYAHYYGPASGPVLNTIYPPMSSLAYFPVGFAGTTLQATIITALIGGTAFYLPVGLLLFSFRSKEPGGWLPSFYTALFFLMVTATSLALRGSAFFQPVDPIALGFATTAGLCLYLHIKRQPQGKGLLSASAAFAVLAVWSKQTMVPLGLALPTFLLAACGWQQCRAYLVRLTIFALSISGVFLLAFPATEMFFNIWTLPSEHPFRSDRYPFMYGIELLRSLRETAFIVPLGLAALAAVVFLHRSEEKRSWRNSIAEHPWLLFAWIALLQVPTSYLGFLKEGGRANSFSPVLYFATVVAAIGLLGSRAFPGLARLARDEQRVRHRLHGVLVASAPLLLAVVVCSFAFLDPNEDSRLRSSIVIMTVSFAAVLLAFLFGSTRSLATLFDFSGRVLSVLIALYLCFHLMHFSLLQFSMPEAKVYGPVIGAYNFAKERPEQVYLPYDPLTTLLTDGKLYHFDYGLFDRRLAGREISREHFEAHIPARIRYILYPRWTTARDSPREALRYLEGFEKTEAMGKMNLWWDVYERW